jgi:glutamate-1-semialdehyde 2,1-aminomutase
LAFSDQVHIRRSSEIDPDSMAYFSRLHGALLERGVYLGPSGYEVGFVSAAHGDAVIDEAVSAFTEALDAVFS